ncbi:MAG: phasin family protein, partial [Rhodospirillaceae bacterium]
MHGHYFSFFEEMNATARAKNEALAARAAFVTGVMEQGYRLWLTLLTTEVTEAVKAAQDLSICKSPDEVVEVQRVWFQASSARAITSLQGTIEIANFLVKNLQDTMTSFSPTPASLSPFAALAAPPKPVAAAP